MLITRTPLRISIGGGGTDLRSYYEARSGFVIAAAIDKYVYIAINRTFTDDYFLKYSEVERVRTPQDIRHSILREALIAHDVRPGLEIVSMADIPAGTGLGSSGTFTVGLLRALYAFQRQHVTSQEIAEEACAIEIDRLGQPVGKQDQYIAAFGGLSCFDFNRDGEVTVSRLAVSNETLHMLEEHLVLFFTGYSRSAATILRDQEDRSRRADRAMLANLDRVRELGLEIKDALEDGDCERYAKLMHEHWLTKRQRSEHMSNGHIDEWYELARANGALGGKLVGAGAGGFLLLYASDPGAVRRALSGAGLTEVRFTFDHDGSIVQTRG
jgi:D-glycero-alpha-D-manno-heptose-7-phosphate kinase